MLGMKDGEYDFEIVSSHPLVHPPAPPWQIKVTFDLTDNGLPAATEADAKQQVNGPLAEVVATWRETAPEYARCCRLSDQLNDADARTEKARADLARLGRELQASLFYGRPTALLDKQIADLRAEVEFLKERRETLARLAGDAKDAAEASFRVTLKSAAARLKQEAQAKLRAAGERLSAVAADALREVIVGKQAVAVASVWNIDDGFVADALAGVRPDGFAIDRKFSKARDNAKGPATVRTMPQGVG
jgi:hypothetical protein